MCQSQNITKDLDGGVNDLMVKKTRKNSLVKRSLKQPRRFNSVSLILPLLCWPASLFLLDNDLEQMKPFKKNLCKIKDILYTILSISFYHYMQRFHWISCAEEVFLFLSSEEVYGIEYEISKLMNMTSISMKCKQTNKQKWLLYIS